MAYLREDSYCPLDNPPDTTGAALAWNTFPVDGGVNYVTFIQGREGEVRRDLSPPALGVRAARAMGANPCSKAFCTSLPKMRNRGPPLRLAALCTSAAARRKAISRAQVGRQSPFAPTPTHPAEGGCTAALCTSGEGAQGGCRPSSGCEIARTAPPLRRGGRFRTRRKGANHFFRTPTPTGCTAALCSGEGRSEFDISPVRTFSPSLNPKGAQLPCAQGRGGLHFSRTFSPSLT